MAELKYLRSRSAAAGWGVILIMGWLFIIPAAAEAQKKTQTENPPVRRSRVIPRREAARDSLPHENPAAPVPDSTAAGDAAPGTGGALPPGPADVPRPGVQPAGRRDQSSGAAPRELPAPSAVQPPAEAVPSSVQPPTVRIQPAAQSAAGPAQPAVQPIAGPVPPSVQPAAGPVPPTVQPAAGPVPPAVQPPAGPVDTGRRKWPTGKVARPAGLYILPQVLVPRLPAETAKSDVPPRLPGETVIADGVHQPSAETTGVTVRPNALAAGRSGPALEARGQNFLLHFPDSTTILMIYVAPGETRIGTEEKKLDGIILRSNNPAYKNESPQYAMRFGREFWISETEISAHHYRCYLRNGLPDSTVAMTAADSLPAVQVDWFDAIRFCNWLSSTQSGYRFRLPLECEWEYAAKGANDVIYPWQHPYLLDSLANCGGMATGLYPVHSFRSGRNPRGLYNLVGNVYEWCLNPVYDYAAPEKVVEPDSLFASERALRGGSYANNRFECRLQARYFLPPDHKDDRTGFRILLEKIARPGL